MSLTPRQLEVLRRLADGQTQQEIAREMFLGRSTVQVHVQEFRAALGAHTVAHAITIAFREGILK